MYLELFAAIIENDLKTVLEILPKIDRDILKQFDKEKGPITKMLLKRSKLFPVIDVIREEFPDLLTQADDDGCTPFIQAIIENQPTMVDFFIQQKLGEFASKGHEEAFTGKITQTLTEDITTVTDSANYIPLCYAAMSGKKEPFKKYLAATPSHVINNTQIMTFIVFKKYLHLIPLFIARLSKEEWLMIGKLLFNDDNFPPADCIKVLDVMLAEIKDPVFLDEIKQELIKMAIEIENKKVTQHLLKNYKIGDKKERNMLLHFISRMLIQKDKTHGVYNVHQLIIEDVVAAFREDLIEDKLVAYRLLKDFLEAGYTHGARVVLAALPPEKMAAVFSYENGDANPHLLRIAVQKNSKQAFYLLRRFGASKNKFLSDEYKISTIKDVSIEMIERITELVREKAWDDHPYLPTLYYAIFDLYQYQKELEETKKIDNLKIVEACKTIKKIWSEAKLSSKEKEELSCELELALNNLWKMVKVACQSRADYDYIRKISEATAPLFHIEVIPLTGLNYMRSAHMAWMTGQFGGALGMYCLATEFTLQHRAKADPIVFCEMIFSTIFLVMADGFNIKPQPHSQNIYRRLWQIVSEGMMVGGGLICLLQHGKIDKKRLTKNLVVFDALRKTLDGIDEVNPEKLQNLTTISFVRSFKTLINLLYSKLQTLEAEISPYVSSEKDQEKIYQLFAAEKQQKKEELLAFFSFKQHVLFRLQQVMDILRQKVKVPEMTYELPEGFEKKLAQAEAWSSKLIILVNGKEEGKKTKAAIEKKEEARKKSEDAQKLAAEKKIKEAKEKEEKEKREEAKVELERKRHEAEEKRRFLHEKMLAEKQHDQEEVRRKEIAEKREKEEKEKREEALRISEAAKAEQERKILRAEEEKKRALHEKRLAEKQREQEEVRRKEIAEKREKEEKEKREEALRVSEAAKAEQERKILRAEEEKKRVLHEKRLAEKQREQEEVRRKEAEASEKLEQERKAVEMLARENAEEKRKLAEERAKLELDKNDLLEEAKRLEKIKLEAQALVAANEETKIEMAKAKATLAKEIEELRKEKEKLALDAAQLKSEKEQHRLLLSATKAVVEEPKSTSFTSVKFPLSFYHSSVPSLPRGMQPLKVKVSHLIKVEGVIREERGEISIFQADPEKILEVFFDMAKGLRLAVEVEKNIIDLGEMLHQVDATILQKKTQEIFLAFEGQREKRDALLKKYKIDQIAVMKKIIESLQQQYPANTSAEKLVIKQ